MVEGHLYVAGVEGLYVMSRRKMRKIRKGKKIKVRQAFDEDDRLTGNGGGNGRWVQIEAIVHGGVNVYCIVIWQATVYEQVV